MADVYVKLHQLLVAELFRLLLYSQGDATILRLQNLIFGNFILGLVQLMRLLPDITLIVFIYTAASHTNGTTTYFTDGEMKKLEWGGSIIQSPVAKKESGQTKYSDYF